MRTFITCALSILVVANAALIAQSTATQNATGRVTTVAADSITIQTSTETLTLVVDSSTKVIGKGVGTITSRLKAEGRSPVVTDLVHQYDSVRVKYGASPDKGLRAVEIRIAVKAVRKP
ncbi:MAG: hypothetical protein AB7L91_02500 [Dehalococcoidia bacterium]